MGVANASANVRRLALLHAPGPDHEGVAAADVLEGLVPVPKAEAEIETGIEAEIAEGVEAEAKTEVEAEVEIGNGRPETSISV